VAGAHEQDVALADGDALLALGRLEVRAGDVLARLEPGHAAHARDVEEDAAADESVGEDVDRVDRRSPLGHRPLRPGVVEDAVVGDVAERVDVGVAVVVVVDAHEVLREAHRPRADVAVGQHRHRVHGRLRAVGRRECAERQG
jgi:hypothetical protein